MEENMNGNLSFRFNENMYFEDEEPCAQEIILEELCDKYVQSLRENRELSFEKVIEQCPKGLEEELIKNILIEGMIHDSIQDKIMGTNQMVCNLDQRRRKLFALKLDEDIKQRLIKITEHLQEKACRKELHMI